MILEARRVQSPIKRDRETDREREREGKLRYQDKWKEKRRY